MLKAKISSLLTSGIKLLPLDIISGLEQAKNQGLQGIKDLLDKVIVPIIIAVLIIMLIIQLVGLVRLRRDGEDSSSKLVAFVGTVALAIIFGSWYAWGGLLFDVSAPAGGAVFALPWLI